LGDLFRAKTFSLGALGGPFPIKYLISLAALFWWQGLGENLGHKQSAKMANRRDETFIYQLFYCGFMLRFSDDFCEYFCPNGGSSGWISGWISC
jgi:hypothetical protein